jgi:hypothetical protein
MKAITTLAMTALVLCFTACNNNTKQEAAKTVTSLSPYKAILVQHTVADWDKWLTAFKSSDTLMKAAELTSAGVARGLDNDKYVTVIATAADLQKARDFGASQGLKDAMANSGVTDTPSVNYLDVSFDDTSTIPQSERLMITDKVKDYAAFKKVFDAQTDQQRAERGLILRLFAQSADDPNTVVIFFAVTDMAKAKAWQDSPELKKILADAGVTDRHINWFKWVMMSM